MPPGSGRTQCPAGQPAAQGYGRSPPPAPKDPPPNGEAMLPNGSFCPFPSMPFVLLLKSRGNFPQPRYC